MNSRTDRRAAGKSQGKAKGRPTTVADLRARLDRARAAGPGPRFVMTSEKVE